MASPDGRMNGGGEGLAADFSSFPFYLFREERERINKK